MNEVVIQDKVLERRRELNRKAAQKLRNRQKEKALCVKQEYFCVQSRNTQLNYEVKQLHKRKEALFQQLSDHVSHCRRVVSHSLLCCNNSRDASTGQTFIVTSSSGEHHGVALQLLNLKSLVGNQCGMERLASYNHSITSIVPVPSKSCCSTSSPEVTVDYSLNGASKASHSPDQVTDETSDEGSVFNVGETSIDRNVDVTAKELDFSENTSVSTCFESRMSLDSAEIVPSTGVRRNSEFKSSPSERIKSIKSEPLERSEAVLRNSYNITKGASVGVGVSRLPLVVAALTADED